MSQKFYKDVDLEDVVCQGCERGEKSQTPPPSSVFPKPNAVHYPSGNVCASSIANYRLPVPECYIKPDALSKYTPMGNKVLEAGEKR